MFATKQNNRRYAWMISDYFSSIQRNLFPGFKEELGLTPDKHMKVIVALDMIQVENLWHIRTLLQLVDAQSIVM